jgi:hypothetical protein
MDGFELSSLIRISLAIIPMDRIKKYLVKNEVFLSLEISCTCIMLSLRNLHFSKDLLTMKKKMALWKI